MTEDRASCIGDRTAAALAVKRAQGVQLGRPREMSPEAVSRIWDSIGSAIAAARSRGC